MSPAGHGLLLPSVQEVVPCVDGLGGRTTRCRRLCTPPSPAGSVLGHGPETNLRDTQRARRKTRNYRLGVFMWPGPLSCGRLCPLQIDPQGAAHGPEDRERTMSNRGLHLRLLSIGQSPSHSLYVGMCTNVPVEVGPYSPKVWQHERTRPPGHPASVRRPPVTVARRRNVAWRTGDVYRTHTLWSDNVWSSYACSIVAWP